LERQRKVSAEVELRRLEGSEFQTVGAAMLKPWEAKVVRTSGTDSRYWCWQNAENMWECDN